MLLKSYKSLILDPLAFKMTQGFNEISAIYIFDMTLTLILVYPSQTKY